MLQAQLRGKLTRKEEDMEDLLTSNVFGSIKYSSLDEGLRLILTSSIDTYGNAPIHALQAMSNMEGEPEYEFWRWIQEEGCEGCEPDVLITIQPASKRKIIILVEAKYLSEKSSEANEKIAPTDQLAREWDNLTHLANRKNATPILLYVTADLGYPMKSIEDSCKEYKEKRKEGMTVFWISWRKLPTLFSMTEQRILKDLVQVLRRQGLTFFEGISKREPISIKWSFKAIVNWDWSSYDGCNIRWEYQTSKPFKWQHETKPVEWRFEK